jgi:hypothetical protein
MKQQKQFTKQETFDKVATHLLTQGRKAMSGADCCYLAPDGAKCAAGCLIPKRRYRKAFEGVAVRAHNVQGKLIVELGHDLPLVNALQLIHDYSLPVERFQKLYELARVHQLDTGALCKLAARTTLQVAA